MRSQQQSTIIFTFGYLFTGMLAKSTQFNFSSIALGSHQLPISIVSHILSHLEVNAEVLNAILVSKVFYDTFNNIKPYVLDISFDGGDFVEDERNYFLRKYVSVYNRVPNDYVDEIPSGSYLAVLFSAATRNDAQMLKLAFSDPRILELEPTYKFNFCTYSGFCHYSEGYLCELHNK
jgi:hypothetical protein